MVEGERKAFEMAGVRRHRLIKFRIEASHDDGSLSLPARIGIDEALKDGRQYLLANVKKGSVG
jgi:hypothetical protein